MSEIDESIGSSWRDRAAVRMKELHVRVTDLARAAGYSSHVPTSQHLAKTKARQPPWAALTAYAAALQCTPEWLARGEGEAPAPGPAQPGVFHAFGSETPNLGTMGARALYVRATTALSQAEFARRLSNTGVPVSRQAVRKIEADEVDDPSCKILCAYEELTGFSVRWILWGRGERRAGGHAGAKDTVHIKDLESALAALQEAERNPLIDRLPISSKAELLRIILLGPESP